MKFEILKLPPRTATLGLDGFIDSIVRPIRSKEHNQPVTYFQTIREFGEYTVAKSGANFSLELEESVKKIGGNMPIMAHALAQWNIDINCVGTMGYPDIHPEFKTLPPNCALHSFAEPGVTTALEFNDGKIILGEMSKINRADWHTLKELIGIKKLINLFQERDLIALLNWSELDHATAIWQGIIKEVLPHTKNKARPIGFFDLSDCSKRSSTSIQEALKMLNTFSNWWDVGLSVNLNEARIIHRCLIGENTETVTPEQMGQTIFQQLGISKLIMHYSHRAFAWDENGMCARDTQPISNPLISTGAGDNFNAGFCVALLSGETLPMCLEIAHGFATTYMTTGKSASPGKI